MADTEKRLAAKKFAAEWAGRGDEKQDTQTFWLTLLQKVYGVEEPDKSINFEKTVTVDSTTGKSSKKFIDGYIPSTRTLIEQKGMKIDLRKGEYQSDGSLLTPYQQARRYGGYLPANEHPRWIVICNFAEFHIYDMNRPNDPPEILLLSNLEKEYNRLNFLVNTGDAHIKREMEISMQAGELVGRLYDAFLKQYKDPSSEHTLKSLNMLCVRLVFCLYAEDAGIFGGNKMFQDYMRRRGVQNGRMALRDLFRILDQKEEERDPYLADDAPDLAAFPYVNGGLFSEEDIEIPPFNEEIYDLLLNHASGDFDWSGISPTIFGAVFESTLNPETRRKGGMHYTSIENIHKVIDPLFLDDLRAELEKIKSIAVVKTREKQAKAFQKKLSSLKFLDPACGSGNFLTETYLSLRRLENDVLRLLYGGQITMGFNIDTPIQVSIQQFYGIEINDFAATVAKTALWIAESQMMKQTEEIVHTALDFLPLKSYVNIVEGNALRLDWETVVPKHELHYIMGNPPFIGYTYQNGCQKNDLQALPIEIGKNVDYVAGWYMKASQYMSGTDIVTAFVSTNSITQGEQVESIWQPLFNKFSVKIIFGHRTFRWDSEANQKAQVHCVIIGFTCAQKNPPYKIYAGNSVRDAQNINAYLIDAPNIIITKRTKPISNVPEMNKGSQPTDGGNFIIKEEEYSDFIKKEPLAKPYIHLFLGSDEFLNSKKRFCLWLNGITPKSLSEMKLVFDRVKKVQNFRLSSKKEATRRWADMPTLFTENRQPSTDYIVIPEVSSGNRRYVPIGFLSPEVICSNKLQLIPNATIYHFGVLTSNVHMAWMRSVCGRLKSDYDYSAKIVYNNFPWPTVTETQKRKIEQTAQGILDARALYPDCSLAALYDETTMPNELRDAHRANDRAVMEAYGLPVKGTTEASCVAELMRRYQELTKE